MRRHQPRIGPVELYANLLAVFLGANIDGQTGAIHQFLTPLMNFRRGLRFLPLLRHRLARLLRETRRGWSLGASAAIVTIRTTTAWSAAATRALFAHFANQ